MVDASKHPQASQAKAWCNFLWSACGVRGAVAGGE
jgi:hypothetical protein